MTTAKSDAASTVPASSMLTTTNKRKTKQPPPVRLPDAFYRRLSAAAKFNSRSVPKHIEHLVNIAESIDSHVSREDLLDVQSGLSRIVVEKIEAPRVDKQVLFGSLESMRSSGVLSQVVTTTETKYQVSPTHPGYLERISDDGGRDVGMFKGGKFRIAKHLA